MSKLDYAQLEAYREEIRRHCYRMTGSFQEAEDLAQETLVRAWRGLESYRGEASPRGWLYRIAGNVCLSWLAGRGRRVMPRNLSPMSAGSEMLGPRIESALWVTPYPTSKTFYDGPVDPEPGPEGRALREESVRLAFVVALQKLPARQRAVLLMREVLGFSARQTSEALETSVAAVNSALQRARATLAVEPLDPQPSVPRPEQLARYVRAWERLDPEELAGLLTRDAVLAMPPYREWYRGPEEIKGLLAWAWARKERGRGETEMRACTANGQPAFVQHLEGRLHSLQLLEFGSDGLRSIVMFHRTAALEEYLAGGG